MKAAARSAFTLAEMLAVIAIIAIMLGFLLGSVGALRGGTQTVRTETIIETLRQTITLTATEQGSYPQPAEHPLAGSYGTVASPRFAFVRSTTNGGGIVSESGTALKGVSLANLGGSDRTRLLLDDDYYADPNVPALYGMQRERLSVLGAPLQGITDYVRIPTPVNSTRVYNSSEILAFGSDKKYVVSPTEAPIANAMTIDYVLGSTNAKSELSKLNDKSRLNELNALYAGEGSNGTVIAYDRAWTPNENGTSANWKPGFMQDPADSNWKRYRLRGLGIYDAWGVEILFSISNRGVVRLMSAGRDGLFKWDPVDGTFETAANASVASGNDIDGSRDNVILVTDDE